MGLSCSPVKASSLSPLQNVVTSPQDTTQRSSQEASPSRAAAEVAARTSLSVGESSSPTSDVLESIVVSRSVGDETAEAQESPHSPTRLPRRKDGPEDVSIDQTQGTRLLLAADTENVLSASSDRGAARGSPAVASSSPAFPRDSLQDENEGEGEGEQDSELEQVGEEENEEEAGYRYISPSVTAGGEGSRKMESELLKSGTALQALSVELERRRLKELWVDPTGDSLFEALAQQLYSMARTRENLEAQGFEFVEPPLPVDGLRVWRFVSAALRCRQEVARYMADPARFSDEDWEGILPEDRAQYLADLAQPGTAGGARELIAAAGVFGMEVCCFHVSPKGLSHSVISSPGAEGGLRPAGVLHLIECSGGFWSAVPEGFGSPTAPSPSPWTPSVHEPAYNADAEKPSTPAAASPRAADNSEAAITAKEQDAPVSPAMPRLAPSPPSSRDERPREPSGSGLADPDLADTAARSQDRGGGKRGWEKGATERRHEPTSGAQQAPATYAEKQWRKLQAKLKTVPSVVSQQVAHGFSKMGPAEPSSKATWRRPEQLKYIEAMQRNDDFGEASPLTGGWVGAGMDQGARLESNALQGSASGVTGSLVAAARRDSPLQVLFRVS